jgi:GGDEF domain-containing protein
VVYRVSADQFAVVLPQDAHNVEAIQVAKLELGIGIDPDLPTEPLKRVEG